MATKYEYYDIGENSADGAYGVDPNARWISQTFTVGTVSPNQNHNITSVKLLLGKVGSPGTVYVSIKATDVNGKPTGADLSTGTTNGNTLPEMAGKEWREINMSAYTLLASTKYAIVVIGSGADSSNSVYWWENYHEGEGDTYIGGSRALSINSGSSWILDVDSDFLFEVWGEAEAPPGTNIKINIGGVLKDVVQVKQNIGGVLKDVFG